MDKVHDQPWSYNGPSRVLQKDLFIFETLSSYFYLFYKLHSLNPLNIVEHILVIIVLYQGSGNPPTPSWTPKWIP